VAAVEKGQQKGCKHLPTRRPSFSERRQKKKAVIPTSRHKSTSKVMMMVVDTVFDKTILERITAKVKLNNTS
jgi:hypothetical protein